MRNLLEHPVTLEEIEQELINILDETERLYALAEKHMGELVIGNMRPVILRATMKMIKNMQEPCFECDTKLALVCPKCNNLGEYAPNRKE